MKKVLSVLLATLLLLGVFAVGASAFERPTIEQAKQSRFNPFPAANLSAQADDDKLPEEILTIMEEVVMDALIRLFTSEVMMADMLAEMPAAYKLGKTAEDLEKAIGAVDAKLNASQQKKDLDAFLADTEAIKAAYTKGTLKNDLAKLYNAVIDFQIAEMKKVLKEFFTADAMNFLAAYGAFFALILKIDQADLTTAQAAALEAKMNALDKKYSNFDKDLNTYLKAGNFKQATKLLKNVTKDLKKIMADFGLVKDASVGAKIWNFILKWIFFGWIWM